MSAKFGELFASPPSLSAGGASTVMASPWCRNSRTRLQLYLRNMLRVTFSLSSDISTLPKTHIAAVNMFAVLLLLCVPRDAARGAHELRYEHQLHARRAAQIQHVLQWHPREIHQNNNDNTKPHFAGLRHEAVQYDRA